ncbi:MAG TPA: protein kinase [Thermoanaerobaculia bacterium]|nr:protein kinase [Thermoanaerobaculia bacterium]
MTGPRDRLEGMTGGAPVDEDQATRSVPRPREGRRLLLYAPPPARARHFLALLEAEGWEVMLATEPAAAELLLGSWPPHLLVAVVPLLAPELRERWRTLAPEADVRWVGGLGELLEQQLMPPQALLDFTARALGGLLDQRLGGGAAPAEVVRLATAAARELGLGERDLATVRLEAVLYRLPELLAEREEGAVPDQAEATERSSRAGDRRLLAEFAAATGCPLPLGLERPADGSGPALPLPGEIVEAALRLTQLRAQDDARPAQALRRLAREGGRLPGTLHPAAVEAVLAVERGAHERAPRGSLLLADPDAGARNLLALRLRNEGYTVRTVADGRAALEEVRREPPALLLAEAVLPRLDGFGLLDALAREGRDGFPFLFLSSRSDPLSVNKGLLLGAADYLGKPVDVEVLLTKIQKHLARGGEGSEASARLSLSDFQVAGTDAPPLLSYEQLEIGASILDRFRLLRGLGEGGMGKVFRARDERLEEDVVIKVIRPELAYQAEALERFKREIRLARRITHPNVVRIFDFWEAGPLKFVTMEFLEGSNLRVEVMRRGPLPVPVALRLMDELLQALAAAHQVGIVHRDVKPHNVLLLPSGHVKVLDFGIAQALDAQGEEASARMVAGTYEYMSPEQVAGEALDARTDLYSAGLVFYELLTGEAAFRGSDRAVVARLRLTRDPAPPSELNPKVGKPIDGFVRRLLAREREERHGSASEALAELTALRA